MIHYHCYNLHSYTLNEKPVSGLVQIDPSSLGIRLGGEERATGVYMDINEGEAEKDKTQFCPAERQNQGDFGCFSHKAGERECEKGERRSQQRRQNCQEQILNGEASPKGDKQEFVVKPKCEGYIATIGNYDGMHLGHQEILQQVVRRGQELGLPTVVILFEPQPEEFFRAAGSTPARLMSLSEKLRFLRQQGINKVLCLSFNRELAQLSAVDFVAEILVRMLHVKHLVVGDDFVFGAERQGNIQALQEFGERFGFGVESMPTCFVNTVRVSSTAIRIALDRGNLVVAQELLGRVYSISGRVVHGDKRGRDLGFPTANIYLRHKVLPLVGVYAVQVHVGESPEQYFGVANIGFRPTIAVAAERRLLEVHIFDFQQNIYGYKITVDFLYKLRDEKRFANFTELQTQIKLDINLAKQHLASELMF